MITLHRDKAREYKIGEVLHLKVVSIDEQAPGKWRLAVEDITPLPGAEATGYGCGVCGVIEEAKLDGSLPDGWTEVKFEEGSYFVCSDEFCQQQPKCHVCGCTPLRNGPCDWFDKDTCSACAVRD